jgi:hypothetical protein
LTGWTPHFKCVKYAEAPRRTSEARGIANQPVFGSRCRIAMVMWLVLMLTFSFEAEQNSGNKDKETLALGNLGMCL